MNRLKLWVYALLVIGLAGFGLYLLAGALRAQGIASVDRQLRAARAQAEAAERSVTGELAAAAALAADDEALAAALRAGAAEPAQPARPKKAAAVAAAPPEQLDRAVEQAGAEAVARVFQRSGLEPVSGRVVRTASREGFERSPPGEADVAALLRTALDGKVARGYAVLDSKLHLAAAVPVGERGAIGVFVPVDAAWLRQQATAATGEPGDGPQRAPLALVVTAPSAGGAVSNAPAEAAMLATLAARAVRPAPSDSSAVLLPVDVTPAWSPVKVPAVRPLLRPIPADRVTARELPGVKGGYMVLAASTAAALQPVVRFEWYALAGLALALLLAIPFSLLVKPSEVTAALPQVLIDAARRIEKGDFSVRAPVLAGKLGTLAAAMNKAVEAAQAGPTPVGSVTSEFYARAPEPADEPFSLPLRGSRSAAPEPKAMPDETGRIDGANLSGSAFEAAPVPAAPKPSPAPAPAASAPAARPAPAPTPAPVASAAPAPARAIIPPAPGAAASELLAGAARASAAGGDAGDEEQHWREVFRDFVRTRAECGESAEGLTYERFRQKLESNKGALVAKYGCKTVRFQVYVKDGKAALKATPVR